MRAWRCLREVGAAPPAWPALLQCYGLAGSFVWPTTLRRYVFHTNHPPAHPLLSCVPLSADAAPELQAQVPPLQTPFQAQSFCPAWRAAHSYRLQLTGAMLEALASQVSGWAAVDQTGACLWHARGACPYCVTCVRTAATCRACGWRCGTAARGQAPQRMQQPAAAAGGGSGRCCLARVLCLCWMCCASHR